MFAETKSHLIKIFGLQIRLTSNRKLEFEICCGGNVISRFLAYRLKSAIYRFKLPV